MKVYHGSTLVVEHPLAKAGRPQLDFGWGFYVTDIQSQAETWAERMSRIKEEKGVVNVYDLDMDKVKASFCFFCFEQYDESWLRFIVSNRMGGRDYENFDVVEGGVANDRVIDTVEAYMSNLMPLDLALRELSKHKPNNQLCITNQKVIDECLSFVESYNI